MSYQLMHVSNQSRSARRKRAPKRYLGEEESLRIVEWLNGSSGATEEKTRFASLLDRLKNFELLLARYDNDDPDSLHRLSQENAQLNGLLSQYTYRFSFVSVGGSTPEPFSLTLLQTHPRVMDTPAQRNADGSWNEQGGHWREVEDDHGNVWREWESNTDETVRIQLSWEPVMVQLLLGTIWPLRKVNRLRQCRQCSRWLFARLEDQKFCAGTNCAQKHRQSTDSFKAYRRAYMRKYYGTLETKQSTRKWKAPKRNLTKARPR
jgi:hypothetical protein